MTYFLFPSPSLLLPPPSSLSHLLQYTEKGRQTPPNPPPHSPPACPVAMKEGGTGAGGAVNRAATIRWAILAGGSLGVITVVALVIVAIAAVVNAPTNFMRDKEDMVGRMRDAIEDHLSNSAASNSNCAVPVNACGYHTGT